MKAMNRGARRAFGLAALVAMAGAVLAGGCSSWGDDDKDGSDCVSVEEYQSALPAPTLSVPPGLTRPDEAGRLNIPEEPLPTQPLADDAACLQRPPSYFDKPLIPAATN